MCVQFEHEPLKHSFLIPREQIPSHHGSLINQTTIVLSKPQHISFQDVFVFFHLELLPSPEQTTEWLFLIETQWKCYQYYQCQQEKVIELLVRTILYFQAQPHVFPMIKLQLFDIIRQSITLSDHLAQATALYLVCHPRDFNLLIPEPNNDFAPILYHLASLME
jgi:Cu2+-containing amine oxidase